MNAIFDILCMIVIMYILMTCSYIEFFTNPTAKTYIGSLRSAFNTIKTIHLSSEITDLSLKVVFLQNNIKSTGNTVFLKFEHNLTLYQIEKYFVIYIFPRESYVKLNIKLEMKMKNASNSSKISDYLAARLQPLKYNRRAQKGFKYHSV